MDATGHQSNSHCFLFVFYPSHFMCWNHVTILNHQKWQVTVKWVADGWGIQKKYHKQVILYASCLLHETAAYNIVWTQWKRRSWQRNPEVVGENICWHYIHREKSKGVSQWLQYSQCFSIFLSQNTCCYSITGESRVKCIHLEISSIALCQRCLPLRRTMCSYT